MSGEAVLPYGRQQIDDDDVAAVVEALRGDWLTQGPAIPQFEAALCAALGSRHAVAVNSGTAALHLGMMALGIGPGDVVFVPPITFVASANAALYCGADVAFADVEPDTGLLTPETLEEALRSYHGRHRPVAAVAVHMGGLPCDLDGLAKVCTRHGLELIEDACHALGATWTSTNGAVRRIGDGTVSAFETLSFHPVKHITTGEGGAVLTSRPRLADAVRELRTHGVTRAQARLERQEGSWWYEMHALGFNYRLPDVLAALGTSQLRKHEPWLARRRSLAHAYRQRLSAMTGIEPQALRPGRESAYHLFPILVESRGDVFAHLVSHNIKPQVHYIPVHQQPFYVKRYGVQHFPGAERWYAREISLPMFPGMQNDDVTRVCDVLAGVAD